MVNYKKKLNSNKHTKIVYIYRLTKIRNFTTPNLAPDTTQQKNPNPNGKGSFTI